MTQHFEFLVEDQSMEVFLRGLLPRLLPPNVTFKIHSFQGKHHLLKRLEQRLRGYATWLPPNWRLMVIVDRDHDDCQELKSRLEQIAANAGIRTRSRPPICWQLVNRIAIEELEAWYFGEWDAVRCAFPGVGKNVPRQKRFRNPDAITDTWEAFERILQRYGYFKGGLPKIRVAKKIGQHFDPTRCRSQSFICFHNALKDALQKSKDCM
ncbi:MAG: DUF4276 family protein [Rhodothermus sp.]|nr:DUF4276 family protein [Rhodothermus sp.]